MDKGNTMKDLKPRPNGLKGPVVPDSFVDDGHSVPHARWVRLFKLQGPLTSLKDYVDKMLPWTARIHDFQYAELRAKKIVKSKLEDLLFTNSLVAKLESEIKKGRKQADKYYKHNVVVEGKQNGMNRVMRFLISKRFFFWLRRMGWTAINGEGHPQNAEALQALVGELMAKYESGVS